MEDNICYHERLDRLNCQFDSLKPPPIKNAYSVILNELGVKDLNTLHLYVYNEDAYRNKESIISVTQRQVKCSVCHTGRKQKLGESKTCGHASVIWDAINSTDTTDPTIMTIKKVYDALKPLKSPKLIFDKAHGIWKARSLSDDNESLNFQRHGMVPVPVPKSIDDPELVGSCEIGRDKLGSMYFDSQDELVLYPKLPSFKAKGACCCYYNKEVCS
jgi:hypothetical protein